MKLLKYKLLPYLMITCFLVISCESQLEDVLPTNALAPETVTSAADVEKLLVGIYDGVQNGGTLTGVGVGLYYLSFLTEDLSADNLAFRATFFQHGEVDDNTINVENVLVQRYWLGPYVAIGRCNDLLGIIDNLDTSEFSGDRKNGIIGETRFLRALSYFRLVSLFGGVPVLTVNTIEKVPRDSEDVVWSQIEADLDAAIANSPEFSNASFVSKDAARALRARVALIRGDYSLAATLSEEVIATGNQSLVANYADMWIPAGSGTRDASEMILEMANSLTDGTFFGFFLTDGTQPFGNGGRLELPADETLVAAYEPGDTRFAATIDQTFVRPGFSQVIKFSSGLNGDDPYPVTRLAEMYLISAEASAFRDSDPSSGLDRLNEIRVARGLAPILVAPADLESWLDIVLQERRVELAIEGHRWQDLRRTGRAIDVLPNVTSADQLLYPIPQSELDVNDQLVQNPGY